MKDDTYYMRLALKEADKAALVDEVPVGAVIIDDRQQIIGTGFNQPISSNDPTSHAEIIAIRSACRYLGNYRLPEVTLYATIEPCVMCMGAIIHARIKRLVYGADDIKWGAAASLYNIPGDLRMNHHPEVVSGVCAQEAREKMQRFFKNKRS